MIDIPTALRHGWPDAEWILNGNEYNQLVWLSDSQMPTSEQIEAAYFEAVEVAKQAEADNISARAAAIAHAKSLGFTDEMISVMYPNLGAQA